MTTPRRADLVRQGVVLVGAVLAIVAAFYGSGAFGGPDQQGVGDGALAADATHIAPGSPAFSIWSVIYTGLAAYAIWQALPSQRDRELQRRVGWWVLASMVLNSLWITVVQADLLGLSVPVIVVLLAVLVVIMARLVGRPAQGWWERLVLDGTVGLYLGWVSVATAANVAAVLASAGFTDPPGGADLWAVVVLLAVGAVGVAEMLWTRGRFAVAAAIVWGLAWVAVARLTGDLRSIPAAIAALAAAAGVLVALAVARSRRRVAPTA